MPSTRMPWRYERGMRHDVASMRSSGPRKASFGIEGSGAGDSRTTRFDSYRSRSNIDDDFSEPAVAGALELQAMVGNGLHFVIEGVTFAFDRLAVSRRAEASICDAHVESCEQ